MTETVDFIVVSGSSPNPSSWGSHHRLLTCGVGGTSGCLLAATLSSTQSRPSVLLIEAGGEPVGDTLRSPYDRYTPAFTRPDLDHGYSTTAKSQLNGRVLPHARGKGLGGSSALTFTGTIANYGGRTDGPPLINIQYTCMDRQKTTIDGQSWWETTVGSGLVRDWNSTRFVASGWC